MEKRRVLLQKFILRIAVKQTNNGPVTNKQQLNPAESSQKRNKNVLEKLRRKKSNK